MFDFLFRRKAEPPPEPKPAVEHEIAPETEVFVTRRLSKGLPVTISSSSLLESFEGCITSENNISLTISRLPGEMALKEVERGATVTLLAYNADMEHVRVTATVVDSTVLRLILRDWVLEDDRSKRMSKRLPLQVVGKLYALEDTRMSHPRVCTVLDLSENGARISTSEKFATGDSIRLQLEVFKGDGVVSMPGQVVWVAAPEADCFEYGLVFAELERRKARDLHNSLKELEQQLRKKAQK